MNVGVTRKAIGVVVAVLVSGGLAGCGGDTTETASISISATGSSSATEEQDAVLAQEARWLTAITAGDRDTIESILSPDFKHITSEGKLLGRDEEIASIVPVAFTMNATEQTVDIVGDTAVIHASTPSPRRAMCWPGNASPMCSSSRTARGWHCRRRRPRSDRHPGVRERRTFRSPVFRSPAGRRMRGPDPSPDEW